MTHTSTAKIFAAVGATGAILGTLAIASHVGAHAVELDLQFVNHIQAELPEQDVFVEKAGAPANRVFRVEEDDTEKPEILNKRVYAAATTVAHDPFKLGQNPLGPYPKGKSLGITLGEWLSATGTGRYVTDGTSAELNLAFAKLVRNGVYTVWCSRLTFPPNAAVLDAPCGKADGSENSFRADASGNGSFGLKLPDLPDSSQETATVIALAYHSDGKSHGADPGDFGLNSHVQIISMIPPPPEPPPEAPPPPADEEDAAGSNALVWVIVGFAILAVIVIFWARRRRSPYTV